MSESRPTDPAASHRSTKKATTSSSWHFTVFFVPIAVAVLLYQIEPFEPVHYPAGELSRVTLTMPATNDHMLIGSEVVGKGQVAGPEDLVYDAESRVIYTGCLDGWVKRVTVAESAADSVVENWINTGGRPLGLALGRNGEVIVADPDKGLLGVTKEGKIELLTDEVDGVKFRLTNGVDVAEDGTIYFTDASYKYSLKDFTYDILEGGPNGRLMSYEPATKKTTLLATNLYFPNGVAVSPDQTYLVFCESMLRRCSKYYIRGPDKGSLDKFIHDLPGVPDNIHYDGQGHYWIGLCTAITPPWEIAIKFPAIRKVMGMITKYVGRPHMEKNGGAVAFDLEGKPIAHYYDPHLSMVSSAIKIGNHLYSGNVASPFILRLDINKYPALPSQHEEE